MRQVAAAAATALGAQRGAEWWIVEGKLLNVNALRKRRNVDDASAQQTPTPSPRHRMIDRMTHLSRAKLEDDGKLYWRQYMRSYGDVREEWEKLVWDSPVRTCAPVTYDAFFDTPRLRRTKKKKKMVEDADKKPFSMEEIQAAIREKVKRPSGAAADDGKIEYRTASDSKWPF